MQTPPRPTGSPTFPTPLAPQKKPREEASGIASWTAFFAENPHLKELATTYVGHGSSHILDEEYARWKNSAQ